MSDILAPQGYEDAEALKDEDLMEVYQPTSGGVRRNKKGTVAFFRDFFKKLPVFTANNLVQADATGTLRTTSLSTVEVTDTVTRSQNNEVAIGALDQRVDGNDTDIQNNANAISVLDGRIDGNDSDIATLDGRVDGHDTDIATLDGRVDGNDTDIATLDGRVDGHDADIANLQNKTPQSYKATDTVTFFDVFLNTVGSVKNNISSLLSRMTATEGATGTNTTNIDINSGKITALENQQPTETTDDVEFNSLFLSKGRKITEKYTGANISESIIFDALEGFFEIGEFIVATGTISTTNTGTNDIVMLSHIVKTSSSQIAFLGYGMSFSSGQLISTSDNFIVVVDGSTSLLTLSIAF